ncbi:MAG: hypothetical protein ABIJ96_15050 [Elusimicrobiota bacterium]
MSSLWILCWNSCREQLRSRFFPVSLIFAGVAIYISTLLGILAADEELRVLLDFGLSFIELMASTAVAFTVASGLVREMETKTIYLILTRPVSRGVYLVGRYLGTIAAAYCAIAVMAGIHLSLLFAKGWAWQPGYLFALLGIALKLIVIAAVATLLVMISTSVLSALCMTSIAWMLGHFTGEIRFLISQQGGVSALLFKLLISIVPDLQLFNFRDRLHVPESILLAEPVWIAVLYAPIYAGACLAFTMALFRKREF